MSRPGSEKLHVSLLSQAEQMTDVDVMPTRSDLLIVWNREIEGGGPF